MGIKKELTERGGSLSPRDSLYLKTLRTGGDWIQDNVLQNIPHVQLFNWLTGDKEPSGQEIYNHLGERISYPEKSDYRSKEEYDEAVRYYTKQKGIKSVAEGPATTTGPGSVAQAPTIYEQAREDYENSQKRAIINKKLDRLRRKALEASYKARAFEFQDRI